MNLSGAFLFMYRWSKWPQQTFSVFYYLSFSFSQSHLKTSSLHSLIPIDLLMVFNHCMSCTVLSIQRHTTKVHTVTDHIQHMTYWRNQPCNNDKIAKLKSATDFISFNAAIEHFSALCKTLAYFRDDVSCGRNNLIRFKSIVHECNFFDDGDPQSKTGRPLGPIRS